MQTELLNALVLNEHYVEMETQLLSINIRANFCQSASQALALFSQSDFDLIIADLAILGRLSSEFVKSIRNSEQQRQSTPVIFALLTDDKGSFIDLDVRYLCGLQYFDKPLQTIEINKFLFDNNIRIDREITSLHEGNSDTDIVNLECLQQTSDIFLDGISDEEGNELAKDISAEEENTSSEVVNLNDIYQFVGEIDQEELQEIVQQFLSNLKEKIVICQQAYALEDFAKIKSIVHTLKSSFLYIGAHLLSQACQQLEAAIEAEPDNQQLLADLWIRAELQMHKVIMHLDEMETPR